MAPKTGVLQGSILSPYLYSVYTNQLPVYLRPQTIKEDTSPLQLAPLLNCLLYEDDVVLIANSSTMVDLLRKCEEHKYAIYDQVIPQATTFNYLGIPFKQGGHLDAEKLVQNNILKAMPTMDALSSIGVRTPNCYPVVYQQSLLTSSCGYQWLMKKEFDVYVGALVVYRVKPPNPAPRHPSNNLSRRHAISCLNTHPRLCMPETIADPISFFLNMLPTHAFVPSIIALSWTWRWPVICTIFHELDQLQHYTTIPCETPHGQKLIEWLRQFN
ncbi:hypothetical protein G6F62_007521 [Rhizopus arrhizus]|nr:hypothetical protein G6F62_007521 [Rhizopus arrhizus]